MRENRPSGSMSGRWKRSMVRLVRHRQTKRPETDRPHLNHRATSRLYSIALWVSSIALSSIALRSSIAFTCSNQARYVDHPSAQAS